MTPAAGHAARLAALLLVGALAFALGRELAGARGTSEGSRELPLPMPALREALRSNDRLEQAQGVTPVLLAMRPDDVEVIAAEFENAFAAGAGAGMPLDLLVERLAALDPQRAYDRILGWPREQRARAWPTLLRAWARSSPEFAVNALNLIRDPDVREKAFPALIRGWAESGQPGVWRYLATVRNPWDREGGVIAVVQQRIARRGVEATLQEIDELLSEPELEAFQDQVLRTTTGLVARGDPARAAVIVDAHRDEKGGARLMRRVAVNWVTQDGPAAMTWLLTQPPSDARGRVMRESYRRWLIRDRTAAMAWMAQRPERAGLEAIFDMHATALARVDPEAARAWVDGIDDPALRDSARLDLALVWHHRDPEAARPWIQAQGLLDEVMRLSEKRAGMRRSKATPRDAAERSRPASPKGAQRGAAERSQKD